MEYVGNITNTNIANRGKVILLNKFWSDAAYNLHIRDSLINKTISQYHWFLYQLSAAVTN